MTYVFFANLLPIVYQFHVKLSQVLVSFVVVEACTYILECIDVSYYTGSTRDMYRGFKEHITGVGANYTKKRLPVKMVYIEIYSRIDRAFEREKQIQKWSHKKKQALINSEKNQLIIFAKKDFQI